MIRNIIFDLGNVLLNWKPGEYFELSGYDPKTANTIENDIFRSPEWLSLDNGDITSTEAIELIASKSSLTRDQVSAIFALRTKIIFPLDENIKLLPALKKGGFKLYYLSNFPLDFFNEVKDEYDFFRYFDGGIISAEVKCSKPDAGIFNIFLERFGLDPFECLYIDDLDLNVRSAELIGMKAIHLAETESLENKIIESGVYLNIASSKHLSVTPRNDFDQNKV